LEPLEWLLVGGVLVVGGIIGRWAEKNKTRVKAFVAKGADKVKNVVKEAVK
jgi:hypothetical protein